MSTNSTAYMRAYRAKMRAQGKCQCGREAIPGKANCARCLSYSTDPHPCARCGGKVLARKSKLCRDCAAHFNGLRAVLGTWSP